MWKVVFTKQAMKDARKLKASGLKPKAKKLIEVLKEDPFRNPPAYEALVGNLAGLYSRRINIQHRLVYQVIEFLNQNSDDTADKTCKKENDSDKKPLDPIQTGYLERQPHNEEGAVKIIRMWSHYDNLRKD